MRYHNLMSELKRKKMTVEMLSDKLRPLPIRAMLNGIRVISLGEAKQIKAAIGSDLPLEELFEEVE